MLCGGGRCLGTLGRGSWKFRSGCRIPRKHEPHPFDHTLESEKLSLFFLLVIDRSRRHHSHPNPRSIFEVLWLVSYLWFVCDIQKITKMFCVSLSKQSPTLFVSCLTSPLNHQTCWWCLGDHQQITNKSPTKELRTLAEGLFILGVSQSNLRLAEAGLPLFFCFPMCILLLTFSSFHTYAVFCLC